MTLYRELAVCTIISLGLFMVLCECKRSNLCGDTHLFRARGTIKSPLYPSPYPPHVECTWSIFSAPNTFLTLQVDDFDVDEDHNCTSMPCCSLSYLSLPSVYSDNAYTFCGFSAPVRRYHYKKNQTVIKFKSSDIPSNARGFSLSYIIGQKICKANEFLCGDESCSTDCGEACRKIGMNPCGHPFASCYLSAQRCDGVRDCESGRDEIDCDPVCEFKCRTTGCFTAAQKCDGHFDCYDSTDELGCETCVGSRKQCNNAKCLHPTLWCDGNDDCGDNSDEDNCIRNSVISATIMGCLFCGLILVIAVMCALRIYSAKNEPVSLALPHHVAARLSLTHSLSLPVLMDEEILQREPPPAYSVAVGQPDPLPGVSDSEAAVRRSRRHRLRPSIKPPTPPPSTESSSQSSPSRESVTSSSYLSKDDSTLLLSV